MIFPGIAFYYGNNSIVSQCDNNSFVRTNLDRDVHASFVLFFAGGILDNPGNFAGGGGGRGV